MNFILRWISIVIMFKGKYSSMFMKIKTQRFVLQSDKQFPSNHQNFWKTLTPTEIQNCTSKFSSVKSSDSEKLSKIELQRLMKKIGKPITEQQAYQMIMQAQPEGQGYLGLCAFKEILEKEKSKKFDEYLSFLGLTYDYILEQHTKSRKESAEDIELLKWKDLRQHLYQNFGIDINITGFAHKKTNNQSISKKQFLMMFS